MNQTPTEIYEEYRNALVRALEEEELQPQKFQRLESMEAFVRKVESLDALINLYFQFRRVVGYDQKGT